MTPLINVQAVCAIPTKMFDGVVHEVLAGGVPDTANEPKLKLPWLPLVLWTRILKVLSMY